MLGGTPAFCSKHHNPKDAGPFGCDFLDPDDFDVPREGDDVWNDLPLMSPTPTPNYNRDTFIWTDIDEEKHQLEDITNRYLQNIINFLKGKSPKAPRHQLRLNTLIEFLEKEQEIRNGTESGN